MSTKVKKGKKYIHINMLLHLFYTYEEYIHMKDKYENYIFYSYAISN